MVARKRLTCIYSTFPDGRQHDVLGYTKILIDLRQHNYFIIRGYMFRPFKRSASGLLTD